MPLSKSFSSDENFIFFNAPDLNVHERSISYVKSCRALWKQGNTSIIARDKRNIYYQASIEATPQVLTLEVSSILYIGCLSFKHFGLWETVLPYITYLSRGRTVRASWSRAKHFFIPLMLRNANCQIGRRRCVSWLTQTQPGSVWISLFTLVLFFFVVSGK